MYMRLNYGTVKFVYGGHLGRPTGSGCNKEACLQTASGCQPQ